MEAFSWILVAILAGFIFVVFVALAALRRVVSRDEAHVVIRRGKANVYSGTTEDITGYTGTTYYEIPKWFPGFGLIVDKVPLDVIEVTVPDILTFAAKNVRFQVTASVYVRVTDPLKAAQRWPGETVEDFKKGVNELIENAVRNTTTAFQAENVIEEREIIAETLKKALEDDMAEYGCIVTNVAIIEITDAPGSTVITDLARKREAEINAESRKMIALKEKEATIVEAENRQEAQIRVAEADQRIFIAEQKAAEEKMNVQRIREVREAEIKRDAAIQIAEGEKQATIRRKEGEAEGIKAVGFAEANVVEAKGLAEARAKEAMAEALNKLTHSGREFRELDVRRDIGVAGMDALGKSKLTLISTQPLHNIIDLFGASGGANLGGMVEAAVASSPKLEGLLAGLLRRFGSEVQGGQERMELEDEDKQKGI